MTTTTAAPRSSGPPSAPAAQRRRDWIRRHRAGLVIAAGLVAATTFALVGGTDSRYTGDLDPANPDPAGGRAVAQVLGDEGIEVEVVRDADAFDDAVVDRDTTVLVTTPDDLARSTADRLRAHAADADLVVVAPGFGAVDAFGADEGVGYGRTRKAAGDCPDTRFDGLRLETRTGIVYPAADDRHGPTCFDSGPGALLVHPEPGVTFLGAQDLLSNEQVTRSDNAAVALRLLGSHDRLVWYVPDPDDARADEGVTVSSLLPDWLPPSLVLLCVAVIALITWRFRRHGALAVEPLPVSITAIESTRSRGRLYRKVGDRGHAAAALRRSTATGLVTTLGLAPQTAADPGALVTAVLPYTQLGTDALRRLLAGPAPSTDPELIALANDLAALLREVRD